MRMRVAPFLKVVTLGAVLSAASLGSVVVFTDPSPKTLPSRVARWFRGRPQQRDERAPARGRDDSTPAYEQKVPPFSDIVFDDSGYGYAFAFTGEVRNHASLAQMRESVVNRNRR